MVLAEADYFVEGVVEIGFGTGEFPFVGFKFLGCFDIPKFESACLVGGEQELVVVKRLGQQDRTRR